MLRAPPARRADLAGRIRNQLRARAFEAEESYWTASEAFVAARVARAAAIAAQRLARLQASIRDKVSQTLGLNPVSHPEQGSRV